MQTIDFIGHLIRSGKKRIINFPARKFEEFDNLLKELELDNMKELYFKIHLEPIILKKPKSKE